MKVDPFEIIMQLHGEGDAGAGGEGGGNSDNGVPGAGGDTGDTGSKPSIFDKPAGDGSKPSIFDKPAGDGGNTPPPDAAGSVPEAYEFKLGEGLSISDELKARFTKIAKEAKLTQAQAGALLDMHSETMLELIKAGETQASEWEAECAKQGLLSKEKLGYAVEALNVFGGDEAKKVLIETGAANHPAVMKMLQTIGELIHEDTNKEGANTPPPKEDLGSILFSNSKY